MMSEEHLLHAWRLVAYRLADAENLYNEAEAGHWTRDSLEKDIEELLALRKEIKMELQRWYETPDPEITPGLNRYLY